VVKKLDAESGASRSRDNFRAQARWRAFLDRARDPESQGRTNAAMKRGFQTRNAEMDLDRILGELVEP